jgi:hypothetical protein
VVTSMKYAMEDLYDGENMWILQRSLKDSLPENNTNPPIAPFETGFKGLSASTLDDIFKPIYENVRGKVLKNLFGYYIDNVFVILDEQSLKNKTVLICHWWEEYVDADGFEHGEPVLKELRQTRVEFKAAAWLMFAFQVKGGVIYESGKRGKPWASNDLFDEDGVYRRIGGFNPKLKPRSDYSSGKKPPNRKRTLEVQSPGY